MFLSITDKTRGTVVARRIRVARSWKARLIGLLATPSLAADEGLWLSPCTSVHTFFMRYPIDVIFLDSDYRVLHWSTLAPWRLSRISPRAMGVLELAAGQASAAGLRAGDQLIVEEQP